MRLDGSGITGFQGAGAGIVNCQGSIGPWETFEITNLSDGASTIGVAAFSNVFLRLDGNGATHADRGEGAVNANFNAGPWEHFRLVPQAGGGVGIESASFSNTFLRMDGSGVTSSDRGQGVVNAQSGCGPGETFFLIDPDAIPAALTADQTRTAIKASGPAPRFHRQDAYLMCSFEWFLSHAELHDDSALRRRRRRRPRGRRARCRGQRKLRSMLQMK